AVAVAGGVSAHVGVGQRVVTADVDPRTVAGGITGDIAAAHGAVDVHTGAVAGRTAANGGVAVVGQVAIDVNAVAVAGG
ncbi:hypothetical protein LCT58_23865, partial [Escherichia coli]|uniref:hypothetical protein n=1 Tax=Escherichia coli TaxID=562 RepID=UPI001EFC85AB